MFSNGSSREVHLFMYIIPATETDENIMNEVQRKMSEI